MMACSVPALLLLVLGTTLATCGCAMVNEYGEYEKVTVAFSPLVNTVDVSALLQNLEVLFQDVSSLLHSASKGHFSFKEIIFVQPKGSNVTLTGKEWIVGPTDGKSDVYVLEKGLFQNNLYTIQHQGCGEQGLGINVPMEFLLNATRSDKSKSFIREWAHYRYGVFEEHGFLNDSLYPLYQSIPGKEKEEFSVTGCTNRYPSYRFRDKMDQPCQPPVNDCFPTPARSQNEDIFSSLMHKPLFPNVNQFCDDNTHDGKSQTKQNTLCKGQSTWKIISASSDFERKRFKLRDFTAPTFKYTAESSIRLVFAVDTKYMKEKMEQVRNAFSYFVLFDLPSDSQISIVDMKTSKASPFVSSGPETRIFDIYPDEDKETEICLHCSLIAALDALKQNGAAAQGVVILATASDVSPERIEIVKNSLPAEGVKLFVIFLGSHSAGQPLLESLTSSTGGQLFVIPNNVQNHDFLSPLTLLYEAFRSIYETFSWTFRNRILLDQKVFHNNSDGDEIIFDVEENIKFLHVIITGPDFYSDKPVMKDKIILKYDGEEYITVQSWFSYKMEIPAYLLTVQNPEVGRWTLLLPRRPKYTKAFEVIIRAANANYSKIRNSHCWISEERNTKLKRIYNYIYEGIKPVIKVTSQAFLIHHETGEEVIIKLEDDGADPDITKNDGVYSKYISNLSQTGFYTLTVVSKGREENKSETSGQGDIYNCCGSTIPEVLAADVATFNRITTCGSFYVENAFPEKQFPPRRIVDLHILSTESLENNIKHYILRWTAPGAHLDIGIASNYEIKAFQAREDALNRFETSAVLTINEWNIHGEWLKTETAGTIQTAIVELKGLPTGFYFLAIRTTNEDGQVSDVSNIIELYFIKPTSPTFITKVLTDQFTVATDSLASTTASSLIESKTETNDTELGIIIGATCGILSLFLVIGVILLLYLSRKRKSSEKKKQRISPPYFPRKTNGSAEGIYQSTNSVQGEQSASYANPVSLFPNYPPVVTREEPNFNLHPASVSSMRKLPSDNASVISYNDSRIYTINEHASDQSSFYDVPLRDERNAPFNPAYTSSLTRWQGDTMSYRLGTDV